MTETNGRCAVEELEGVVLRANSGTYFVQALPGRTIACALRGNLKKDLTWSTSGTLPRRVTESKRAQTKDTVAVGDRVTIRCVGNDEWVIEAIHPRESRFERAAFRGSRQVLVSNLDQLAIVFACAEPNPDPYRIDRWLVAAEASGIPPFIIANKADLADDETRHMAFEEFEQAGYRVLFTSVKSHLGIDALREALKDRVTAFTGPSGVGKSSLLNAIQPNLALATSDIGHVTFKGRHTTTARELIPLESGGWVADTPGLRNLNHFRLTFEDLEAGFPEFAEPLAEGCRFADCRHRTEPGCPLRAAAESGAVAQRRYQSFLNLAAELS